MRSGAPSAGSTSVATAEAATATAAGAELPPLFLTKLPEAGVSLVNGSCVHDLLLLAYYETKRFRIDVTLRGRAVA